MTDMRAMERLTETVTLHCGDCLDVLKTLDADSFDSCVTDPPYGLEFMGKKWDRLWNKGDDSFSDDKSWGDRPAGYKPRYVVNRKCAICGKWSRDKNPCRCDSPEFRAPKEPKGDTHYAHQMQCWHEAWATEVLRVLKPGAHLLAFGGTRTYHRMACAVEDAGFEIRDCVQWLYGQGFAKSYNLNRQPICECDNGEPLSKHDLRTLRQADLSATQHDGEEQPDLLLSRLSQQNISEHGTAWAEPETSRPEQSSMGGRLIHRARQGLSDGAEQRSSESESEWLCAGTHSNSGADARPVIGVGGGSASHQSRQSGQSSGEPTDFFQSPRSLDDRALRGCGACPRCGKLKKAFEGYGTALKPACELIVLARKPLSEGTVAASVLKWGTGALNIDGCRVDAKPRKTGTKLDGNLATGTGATLQGSSLARQQEWDLKDQGRWPANVIHDGSEEVVAGFPESAPSSDRPRNNGPFDSIAKGHDNAHVTGGHSDNGGSAARFFYTAKADADDRLGSKHPTVKPLDLKQYLVRLVTPPGGLVLDCFAGTGTTGEAAWREGMRAVLIEREAEYQDDIRHRMRLVLGSARERMQETVRARMKDRPPDYGPLFGGAAE